MPEDCRSFRRALLVSGPAAAGEAHPRSCPACAAFRDGELASSTAIRRSLRGVAAPDSLRQRVRETIVVGRARRRRVLSSLAAAALLVAVVAASTWQVRSAGQAQAHDIEERLVTDYLEVAHAPDPLDVTDARPATLQRWFAQRLRLAVRLPVLRGGVLRGGRACNIAGRPAGMAVYDVAGTDALDDDVAVFAFEPTGEDWSHMTACNDVAGRRICHGNAHGVALLVWEERGLTYAMTAALEPERLLSLVNGS
jgi:hypothetical protein